MFKRVIVFIILYFPITQNAQDFSTLWKGYFSFYNVKDVASSSDKIYAAAENAVFSYNTQTNELGQLTTVNGLSGENISAIYYSEEYELLLIGYESGLIEIAFDNDDNILTFVDIVDKPTIPPTNKRINHFNPYGNIVYISTNYGISLFNLERLEFGDTYYIGNLGSQINVTQTAVLGDEIYASCLGGNGIRKAQVSSPNLIDYRNWQTIASGDFFAVEVLESSLYATSNNNFIYSVSGNTLTPLYQYNNPLLDLRTVAGILVVTTKSNVFVYDASFNLLSQVSVSGPFNTIYTSATIDSDFVYVGTIGFGILKVPILSPNNFEEIHPEGPLLNTPFSVDATPKNLWVTFGDYTIFHNPYPLDELGISHLKDDKWINIPYEEALGAKCLNSIAVNPSNSNQVFISSYFSGILELNDNIPTVLYNESNSGLEYLIDPKNLNYKGDIRVSSALFDNAGLLWSITSVVKRPLKSYNPSNNQWKSYDFSSIINDPLFDNLGFHDLVIDQSGNKFIASFSKGVIGFNENNGSPLLKNITDPEGNLPSKSIRSLAVDKRNQLWIGAHNGLRVLYNTSNFFTEDDIEADEIIILEDGVAKELLADQFISDIKVDGSNNKWIATFGSGVFYLSSDGQKTIHHFTTDNSPLPSNIVNDISIDNASGEVYMATAKGLVSFSSGSSATQDDLQSAYVYPNPVRPTFNITEDRVKIKDISENVNIKITDIEGNLVAEAQSRVNLRYRGYNLEIDGGTAYWNGKNLANNVVASGVYLIMLSDLDSLETNVLKLMVVR